MRTGTRQLALQMNEAGQRWILKRDRMAAWCSLAALENQIDDANVGQVRAKSILEIANGPITANADATLEERGVTVLPDVLANAGGGVVSHYEWVQNRTGEYWSADQVETRLNERLEREANRCFGRAAESRVSPRLPPSRIAVPISTIQPQPIIAPGPG